MSQVTISGAVSGLDTASLINQLVSVQTNQQTVLKSQQSAVQKRADAYATLSTSLTSLGTLATDLANTTSWTGASATSSSTGVTTTATGTGTGSITFNVAAVAAAHTVIATTSSVSKSDVIASGSITLTKHDGSTAAIAVGTGSLNEVVNAINSSNQGLTATAVNTGAAGFRLQVTSTNTGAASDFSLSGFAGGYTTNVLTQGADASIHIGTNPATAYDVTSATNTFAGLVPGTSFTVSKVETGVTVATKVDGSAIADKVSKLVDSANAILSDIATKTAYDTKTKTGGPLTGESAVRSLQQNILNSVSGSGAPGVQLTRDGKLTFDRTAFQTAFTADPAKVATAFGATSTFTATAGTTATSVTLSGSLKTSRAGTYAIGVTAAPQRESWQVSPPGGTVLSGQVYALTRGTTTVTWTAGADGLLQTAADGLNNASAAKGLGITATVNGGNLVLTAGDHGSAGAFTATFGGVAGTKVTAGTDIAGTIDGQTATGLGNALSLPSGDGGAVGLTLSVSTSSADVTATGGAIGTLKYTPGLAQRLSTLVGDATATSTGAVSNAKAGAAEEIKRFQSAIDAWDDRLTNYRQSLTRQFTAMETALAKLKSSTSALSSLISSSSSNSSSSSG